MSKLVDLDFSEIVSELTSDKELICPKCKEEELETKLIILDDSDNMEYLKLGCTNKKCKFSHKWGGIECLMD